MRISDWSSDVCSSDLILGVLVRPVIGVHRLAKRLRGRLPVAIMVAIAVAARLALPGYGPELLRHLLTVLRLLTFLCLLTGALGGKLLLTLRLGCIAPIAIDRAAQGGRKRMQPTRYPLPCIAQRSEEHTSELQSLMRNSYAVFCLKKKK